MLGGCAGIEANQRHEQSNIYPPNFRSEIVLFMRTYLNDPTQVRGAFVSEPVVRSFEGGDRFSVCVRYNAKKSGGQYAGSKDSVAVFRDARFDRMTDNGREQCKDAAYQPFPELETLSR